MVKKIQKADVQKPEPAGLLDSQLAQTIRDSAQQIWLAGLGAFAKAQGEGNKLFDTLMNEGATLHRKAGSPTDVRAGEFGAKLAAMADDMAARAGVKPSGAWDKLESIFEERTARALSRLGVPTAREVAALARRVDALAAAVSALSAPAAAAGSKTAPRKSAAKKATARADDAKRPARKRSSLADTDAV